MATKLPSEWDLDYILHSLPKDESNSLEFKGRKVIDLTAPGVTEVDRNLLSKALSALANSGGGVLVIGINDKTKKVDDGGVSVTVKPNGTRAWLEDLLPHLLDPTLRTFNVHEIKAASESSLLPDRAIYVIDIGDSPLAPHQATDNRYYGRVAGKSQPLSNRMVLDILNRRQFPNLEIQFFLASVDDGDPNLFRREGKHKVLSIHIENKGPVFAQYVNSILFVPEYLVETSAIRTILNGFVVELEDGLKYVRIARENVIAEAYTIQGGIIGRGPGRYVPILPGMQHSWQIPLIENFTTLRQYFRKEIPKIVWELYADNSPCKKGEVPMSEIKFMSNIVDLD